MSPSHADHICSPHSFWGIVSEYKAEIEHAASTFISNAIEVRRE